METQGEKKQATYFSEAELEVLMHAYEEYKSFITNKQKKSNCCIGQRVSLEKSKMSNE